VKNYNEDDIEKLIKNSSVELFDAIRYTNKDSYQKMIEELCAKDKIDYFDLACQALNKDANSWNLGNILVDFIPYSKINMDSIFVLYEKLYSKDDGTSIHFNITKTLVNNNHDLAKKLLERLLKNFELFIVPHVSAILIELHNSHNDNQYDTVISFLKKDTILELKILNFRTKKINKFYVNLYKLVFSTDALYGT